MREQLDMRGPSGHLQMHMPIQLPGKELREPLRTVLAARDPMRFEEHQAVYSDRQRNQVRLYAAVHRFAMRDAD